MVWARAARKLQRPEASRDDRPLLLQRVRPIGPLFVPQEHGNHTDTRWLSLDNGHTSLRISALRPIEFSASHYTAEDLFAGFHTYDLKPRPETILNLDFRQRGLGTANCGPDTGESYRIPGGHHSWNYLIEARTLPSR